MKILDLFCSNGSTWIDKDYFKKEVLKNDIRFGEFYKLDSCDSNQYNQKLSIITDYNVDVLNQIINKHDLPISDIVYADPPHLVNATGIMFKTYGTLFDNWSWQLDNLVENCNIVCNKILIFKWNDKDISYQDLVNKFSKYFVPGIRFIDKKSRSKSYLIIFLKKY